MITHALYAAFCAPRTVCGFLDPALPYQSAGAAIFGPAKTTGRKSSVAGMLRLESLAAERAALILRLRHLRLQSRCKEASICEAKLRAVTCAILATQPKRY